MIKLCPQNQIDKLLILTLIIPWNAQGNLQKWCVWRSLNTKYLLLSSKFDNKHSRDCKLRNVAKRWEHWNVQNIQVALCNATVDYRPLPINLKQRFIWYYSLSNLVCRPFIPRTLSIMGFAQFQQIHCQLIDCVEDAWLTVREQNGIFCGFQQCEAHIYGFFLSTDAKEMYQFSCMLCSLLLLFYSTIWAWKMHYLIPCACQLCGKQQREKPWGGCC